VNRDEIIQKTMDFPLDKVLFRYRREQKLSECEAREHERELKRFLALVAINHRGYSMRGPIDGLWHTFILFTKMYETFCREVAGRFIHHFPNISGYEKTHADDYPPIGPEQRPLNLGSREYQQLLNDYQALFGELPPAHLWPPPVLGEAGAFAAVECSSDDCGNDPDGPGGGTGDTDGRG
jgi:hypothetical protein